VRFSIARFSSDESLLDFVGWQDVNRAQSLLRSLRKRFPG
jgi:hypothetical protein